MEIFLKQTQIGLYCTVASAPFAVHLHYICGGNENHKLCNQN